MTTPAQDIFSDMMEQLTDVARALGAMRQELIDQGFTDDQASEMAYTVFMQGMRGGS